MNKTLFFFEWKRSFLLLSVVLSILTLYIGVIVSMYDPKLMATLDAFVKAMPQMAAVGMTTGATNLLEFLISYLYGFILLVFPMIYISLCANRLLAEHVDQGSMASLLASPVKRSSLVRTQMAVLLMGVLCIWVYITGLELGLSTYFFPNQLDNQGLFVANVGLLTLYLFMAGLAFLASAWANDRRFSLSLGAGLPGLFFVLQMLGNAGTGTDWVKKLTPFSLFQPLDLVNNQSQAWWGIGVLVVLAVAFFALADRVFQHKDLNI